MYYRFLISTLCILMNSLWAYSQSTEEPSKAYISLASSPAFFFLGGYSAKVFYNLPQHWSFSIQAQGGFELPDFSRDQFFENQGNMDVQWDYVVASEIRYRFKKGNTINQGAFLSGALGYEAWTIENTSQNSLEDSFSNWLISLGIGYNWFPFKKQRFYAGASYNLIFILNNTEERFLGDALYNIRPVVAPSFIPDIEIGWRF